MSKQVGENQDKQSGPIRIGFVVDWLKDSYQLEVLQGAAQAARDGGACLIVLPGGVIDANHDHGLRRNRLYEMIRPDNYDGLVVMTGTLGNAGGTDMMAKVAPDFPKDRVCHIAVEVKGSPTVVIENKTGMRRMIEHLIYVHRCRRIAFIRGPESNPEAEERYQAYCDALDLAKLPFDPLLVVPGDFLRRAGTAAIVTLFDERGLTSGDIDAIVAADDLMAVAAMEELRARGVRVPSDIAVVGFDDVEEAEFSAPPLSTVHQPLARQGEVAVNVVLDRVLARQTTAPLTLNTSCHFRRSCGCTAEDPGALTARPKSDTRLSLRESVVRRRETIAAEIAGAVTDSLSVPGEGWPDELVAAVLDTLDGREEAFRERFDVVLDALIEAGAEASIGQNLISALRRQLSVCAGDDPAQIRRVEGLMHEGRILASNAACRFEAQKRIQLTHEAAVLADVCTRLACACADTQNAVLAQELPRLGISNCVLLTLERGSSELRHQTTLAGGAIKNLSEPQDTTLQGFSPGNFIDYFPHRNLLVQPLDDGETLTGLALFVLEEVKPHLIEIVRELLCSSVSQHSPR